MIKTEAVPLTQLEKIGKLSAEEQLTELAEYIANGRAKLSESMAMRDAAIRALVAAGWSHRQVAEKSGLSIPSVRVIVR